MQLPDKYRDMMQDLLGDEFPAYLETLSKPMRFGLRVNTRKITPERFQEISPFPLEPIPWIENGFFYPEACMPAKHPYYYAGLYYLQEPSAMTPANRLPIEEDDRVLDLCAAPGGKATELGARLGKGGLLVANDVSSSRAKALFKNLELSGEASCCVVSEDPQRLVELFPAFFHKILVDAPCSGEGMFRKSTSMIQYWEEKGPEFYSEIQRQLVLQAADMLKPGGMMLYSTCTFSRMENEAVINYLLDERPEFRLLEMKPYEGFTPGFTEDADMEMQYRLERTVRIFPHKMPGEGHFMALLGKAADSGEGDRDEGHKKDIFEPPSHKLVPIPEEVQDFFRRTHLKLDEKRFWIWKDKAYLLPAGFPAQVKLRSFKRGICLGELKKKRFEPSQSLALTLCRDDYDSTIDLSADDYRVIRYLKGETIEVNDIETVRNSGWQLVCVDGFPLGWGKLVNGRLKNKYDSGWRWQ